MSIVLSNRPVDADALTVELDARVRRGDTASFIAIVPTRRRFNLQHRRWILESPHGAAPKFSLFTLADLVALLADTCLPSLRSVTEELQYALLEQAVDSAVKARSLGYFTPHHKELPRGTLQTILNTIVKLKEGGIRPDDLISAQERNEGREGEKIADVGTLYAMYEEKLKGKFRDTPGTLLELNEALRHQSLATMLDAALPGWGTANNRLIVIEGFSEFRPPECAFLSECARLANVTVAIVSDYADGNDELFGHLRLHLDNLKQDGFPYRKILHQGSTPWKQHIQDNLFSKQRVAPVRNDRVMRINTRNRADEVETIARIVKGLVRERPDRDLSRICVATRLPGQYTTLFREAFADAGIPANITDRFPLASSAVAVGFLALLDLRLRDFRTRDIARALASPYFTLSHGNRPINGENLLSLSAQMRIVGGYRAWIERLESRRALVNIEGADDDGDPTATSEACTRALEDLRLLDKILPLRHERLPATAFMERINALFGAFETGRNVLGGVIRDIEFLERETRALHALREVIAGILHSVLADQRNNEPIELKEYARQSRAAVTVGRYNVRPRTGKGVLITSPEETRGLDIEVMILAGIVDGEFPLPYAPEIFLSKNYQTSRHRHAQDERYLFYQAVTNWTEGLYLLSPGTDDTGKELVASSFLDAIEEHVEYGGMLPDSVDSTIISRSTLSRKLGEHIFAKIDFPVPVQLASLVEEITRHVSGEERRQAHLEPLREGLLAAGLDEQQLAKLSASRDRVWSASQLELYGKCPFQYFSRRLLHLEEQEELEEGLSPLERGNLLHQILFEFSMRRRERTAPPLQGMSDTEARIAKEELLNVARGIIDGLHIQHPFWRLDIERAFGLSETPGMLQKFIAFEQSRNSVVTPEYFEVPFGSPPGAAGRSDDRLRVEEPVAFNGWKLRGKIDRIDAGPEEFVIVDYKTGTPPTKAAIEQGTSLQLPLYIRALENLLRDHPVMGSGRTVTGGMYISFKRDCVIEPGLLRPERANNVMGDGIKHHVLKDGAYEDYIETAFRHVDTFLDGIARGDFQLTRPELRATSCTYCSYRNMCRVRDEVGGLASEEQSETAAS